RLSLREPQTPTAREVADTLDRLAQVSSQLGDFAVARSYHEQAITVEEKLAPGSFETARQVIRLSGLLYTQGDVTGYRALNERALALYEKMGESGSRPLHGMAACLGNLGN